VVGLLQGTISPVAIASQGALQVLAIFFAAGVASIDWRIHIATLTKAMVGVGLPVVIFGGYQMFARTYRWKYAFLPVTLNSEADSGRVDHLPENWEMFTSEPVWGGGLASISSADANGTDVTTFTYFLMLIERGIVGTFFFLAPWVWLGWRAIRLPKTNGFRTVCILLSALNLYTFSYSSMAYTLSFWLALGICASLILRTYSPATHLGLAGMEMMTAPAELDEERVAN
jgi:hypothetical protein